MCPDPVAGDQVDVGGCQSDRAETVQVDPLPTDPESGNGATCHTCGLRRQLIHFLKGGSEYFTPEEVRRIVQAARLGVKGSLNAIDILEEDVLHFADASSDTDTGELREQCCETVQKYEESMRVWKEMKDTGNLCTSDTDLEEEEELTGEDPKEFCRKPSWYRVLLQRSCWTSTGPTGTRAATMLLLQR